MVEPPEKPPVICATCLLRSPNGIQEEDERSHAENESGDPGNFDVEDPSSWIKRHAPSS
jgi:hypothetical protein